MAEEPVTGSVGTADHLLEVRDLHVEFEVPAGTLRAVNGVSYTLDEGERLVILGESGSGKTVSAEAVMGILPSPPARITGGPILFRGTDLLQQSASQRRRLRGEKMAMIFQDALTALNPAFSVGDQIAEMFREHRGLSRSESKAKAIELLERVNIPSARSRVDDFPHQFSGGMRQRVMIAVALALDPEILIADEPTTALDVTVQAQIMDLLRDITDETGMALILITHDFGVAANIADKVAVMYAGRIIEQGPIREVFRETAHPYTEGLMGSIPRADQKGERLYSIGGAPPSLARIPPGCPFHPRCSYSVERCRTEVPSMRSVTPSHLSACHRMEEVLRDD